MCYCNCPHENINGCCREDECTFVKNGMTPPKVLKYAAEIGSSYVNNWNKVIKEMLKDETVSKG